MARGQETAVLQDVAAGHVTGATGAATKVRGAVVARTGTGVYTITINPAAVDGETVTQQGNISGGVPRAEAVCEVQPEGQAAGPCTAQVTHTSDTVKTVSITDDADVAVDADFSFNIRRILG